MLNASDRIDPFDHVRDTCLATAVCGTVGLMVAAGVLVHASKHGTVDELLDGLAKIVQRLGHRRVVPAKTSDQATTQSNAAA